MCAGRLRAAAEHPTLDLRGHDIRSDRRADHLVRPHCVQCVHVHLRVCAIVQEPRVPERSDDRDPRDGPALVATRQQLSGAPAAPTDGAPRQLRAAEGGQQQRRRFAILVFWWGGCATSRRTPEHCNSLVACRSFTPSHKYYS